MAIAVSGLSSLSLSIGAPAGALIAASCGSPWPILGLAALSLALVAANKNGRPERGCKGTRGSAALAPALSRADTPARLAPTEGGDRSLRHVHPSSGLDWRRPGLIRAKSLAPSAFMFTIAALACTLIGGQMADRFGADRTEIPRQPVRACRLLAALGFSLG